MGVTISKTWTVAVLTTSAAWRQSRKTADPRFHTGNSLKLKLHLFDLLSFVVQQAVQQNQQQIYNKLKVYNEATTSHRYVQML